MKKIYRNNFTWLKHSVKNFVERNDNRIPPKGSQVFRVICRFGGAKELLEALTLVGRKHSLSTIYRWLKKSNGIFQETVLEDIIYVSRFVGILLTEDDLDPRVQLLEEEAQAYHKAVGVFRINDIPVLERHARKNALVEELYNKEKAGKIKTEEQLLKERRDYMARYRRMHEASKNRRKNGSNEFEPVKK